MSDFALKVDFIAEMSDFDAALRKMERDMDEVAKEVEQAGKEMGAGVGGGAKVAASGLEGMLLVAGKVMAMMAAFELAFGLAGAAVNLLTGNFEGLRQNLSSLPIIGGLITKMYELSDATGNAASTQEEFAAAIEWTESKIEELNRKMGVLTDAITHQEKLLKSRGTDDLAIAEATYEKRKELLHLEHRERMDLIDKEAQERAAKLVEVYGNDPEEGSAGAKLFDEWTAEMRERRNVEMRMHSEREEMLDREMSQTRRAYEEQVAAQEAAQAEAAAAQEKAEQEAHRLRMEQEAEYLAAQMQGAEDAKRARLEAIEAERAAREAAAQEALALEQRAAEVQAEVAAARAEAEASVRGATGTFATAGGSFTTGVQAQVDQGKVLAKISEQSRDFLAQIVQNTAALGGFGFA